jgi:hypothetical protein
VNIRLVASFGSATIQPSKIVKTGLGRTAEVYAGFSGGENMFEADISEPEGPLEVVVNVTTASGRQIPLSAFVPYLTKMLKGL